MLIDGDGLLYQQIDGPVQWGLRAIILSYTMPVIMLCSFMFTRSEMKMVRGP